MVNAFWFTLNCSNCKCKESGEWIWFALEQKTRMGLRMRMVVRLRASATERSRKSIFEWFISNKSSNRLEAIKHQSGSFSYPIKIQQIQFNLWMVMMPFFVLKNEFRLQSIFHLLQVFHTIRVRTEAMGEQIKLVKWVMFFCLIVWILLGI